MSALTKAMTEDELLQAITEAATLYGWRWHHIRRSDKAVQQGHAGFPDLVLTKPGRLLCLELKSEKGTVAADQAEWLQLLNSAGAIPNRISAKVVRPSDLDSVLKALQ